MVQDLVYGEDGVVVGTVVVVVVVAKQLDDVGGVRRDVENDCTVGNELSVSCSPPRALHSSSLSSRETAGLTV